MSTRLPKHRFFSETVMRTGTGVVFGLVIGVVLFQAQQREPISGKDFSAFAQNSFTTTSMATGYGFTGCNSACTSYVNGAWGTMGECEAARSSSCFSTTSSSERYRIDCFAGGAGGGTCVGDPNGSFTDVVACVAARSSACPVSSNSNSSSSADPPCGCYTPGGCNPMCDGNNGGGAPCTMPSGQTCADLCGPPTDCTACPSNPMCPSSASNSSSSQRCCSGNTCS